MMMGRRAEWGQRKLEPGWVLSSNIVQVASSYFHLVKEARKASERHTL